MARCLATEGIGKKAGRLEEGRLGKADCTTVYHSRTSWTIHCSYSSFCILISLPINVLSLFVEFRFLFLPSCVTIVLDIDEKIAVIFGLVDNFVSSKGQK